MTNPLHCGKPMLSKGLSTSGFRRFKCSVCNVSTTGNDVGRPRVRGAACIHCGKSNTKKTGGGADRYYCYDCEKTFTSKPAEKPAKAKKTRTKKTEG